MILDKYLVFLKEGRKKSISPTDPEHQSTSSNLESGEMYTNTTPESLLLRKELNNRIHKVLDDLGNKKDKFVIIHRYGLDGKGHQTLQQIGDELKVTKENIRQREIRALRRFRHPKRADFIIDKIKI